MCEVESDSLSGNAGPNRWQCPAEVVDGLESTIVSAAAEDETGEATQQAVLAKAIMTVPILMLSVAALVGAALAGRPLSTTRHRSARNTLLSVTFSEDAGWVLTDNVRRL